MLTRSSEIFLKLMQCYLCGQALPDDARPVNDDELEGVYAVARLHHMLPMLFDIWGNAPIGSCDPAHWQFYRRSALCMVTEQLQKRVVFARIYEALLAHGLKPMVVKGIIVAALYPSPDCRTSSDEDLLVEPALRDACAEVLCEAGMIACDDDGRVRLFLHKESGLRIELHSALFPEYMTASARIDGWFADAADRAIEVTVNGWTFYTLSQTDHMLYLVCHAFKHFVHSGFGIRQLCDCMLFELAYFAEIDWDTVWSRLREIRADLFYANLRAICESRFGCHFHTPVSAEYTERIDPDALLEDILEGGVYGYSREERKQSSTITLQALNAAGADAGNETIQSARSAALFPPLRSMRGGYPYLNKAPFLLPVAWMQRAARYMKKRRKGEAPPPDAILEMGRTRTMLLVKYGVIDSPDGNRR